MLSIISIIISIMILSIIAFRAFKECGCQFRFYSSGSASKGRDKDDKGAGSHGFILENIGQYPCKNATVSPLYKSLDEKDGPDEIISGESMSFNHIMQGESISIHIHTDWESHSLIRPVGMSIEYKIFGFIPRKIDVMKQQATTEKRYTLKSDK